MPTAQWEPAEDRSRARPSGIAAVVAVLVLLGVGLAMSGRWDAGGGRSPDDPGSDELAIETEDPDATETSTGPSIGADDPFADTTEADTTEADDAGSAEIRRLVGEWGEMAESPLRPRADPVAVWTGEEVIFWGGVGEEWFGETDEDGTYAGGAEFHPLSDGARYDPATDAWLEMAEAPLGQDDLGAASGVWTGDELLVVSSAGAAAYDPGSDRWRELADPPAGEWVWGTAVWTGEVVAVLGRQDAQDAAIAYDPRADAWRELPPPPISDPRVTGLNGRVVIYGSWEDVDGLSNAITAYHPEEDRWSSPEGIPVGKAVGDGLRAITADPVRDRVILLGGRGEGLPPHRDWSPYLASWRPDANRGWRTLPRGAAVEGSPERVELSALRQGTIAWLPEYGAGSLFSYEGWRPLRASPLGGRTHSAAVWTGEELIVWGGRASRQFRADGAMWRLDREQTGDGPAHLEPLTWGEWPFRAEPN